MSCRNCDLCIRVPVTVPMDFYHFYAPQLVPAGTAEARISYGNSVRPSVRPSRPGGIPSTGEIETPGLHHMVAWSI